MKLYTNLFSPNARKVHAVANELGIELETQTVDLRGGEQRTPEYLTLNPNGKVPTLVDGDTVLWESNAIMCYLAGKGDTDLWPKTAKRYDILRWMFWESNHLSNALNRLFFQKFFSGDNPDQALIELATKDFPKVRHCPRHPPRQQHVRHRRHPHPGRLHGRRRLRLRGALGASARRPRQHQPLVGNLLRHRLGQHPPPRLTLALTRP